MRLLNSTTLKLETVAEKATPHYAILSHTWGIGELLFQHLDQSRSIAPTDITKLAGYYKVKRCCDQAASDGFEYVWIDTCCIDKSSSAELSEAINSMYRWYEEATACYVYLSDVATDGIYQSEDYSFSKSRWFTRGWTLQELLAPRSVVFYGRDWSEIGTKRSMSKAISAITGIDLQFLLNSGRAKASIATKMSWVAKRQTTRVEDLAYCMMGIFEVNMTPIYGEGGKAFMRLQEEIIRSSDDHSIFAWTDSYDFFSEFCVSEVSCARAGLLAKSPYHFANSGTMCPFNYNTHKSPYTITNLGLHITLLLMPCKDYGEKTFLATLNCQTNARPVQIYLTKLGPSHYARIYLDQVMLGDEETTKRSKLESIYINHDERSRESPPLRHHCLVLKALPSPEQGFDLDELRFNRGRGDASRMPCLNHFECPGPSHLGLRFRKMGDCFAVLICSVNYNEYWIDIATNLSNEKLDDLLSSYYTGTIEKNALTEGSDRTTKVIGSAGRNPMKVIASIRSGFEGNRKANIVEIKVESANIATYPQSFLQLKPKPQYQISIAITSNCYAADGNTGLRSARYNKIPLLEVTKSTMCGALIRKLNSGGDIFAIVAGVEENRIWFDIVTQLGAETPKQVIASYYGDRPKRQKKILGMSDVAVRLDNGWELQIVNCQEFLGGLYKVVVQAKGEIGRRAFIRKRRR